MQVIVNGLLTDYNTSGKGKLILMLHGWGDSRTTFSELEHWLSTNYRIISLDLPGFGKSQAPPKAWNLTDYADFLSSFLEKTNNNDIFAVIGHSNGGALAIHAIGTNKISAEKLVLLAASGLRNRGGGKRLAVKGVAKVGKAITYWMPKKYKQMLQKKLYGTIGSDMLVVPHMQETFKLTVRQDVQAEARSLSIPTLLVYGEKDKATPVTEIGKNFEHMIINSKLRVIENAEHFVHLDAPQEVNRLIYEFLG